MRVIAATGRNRDILRRGTLKRVRNDIAEIQLDDGKTLSWPSEFVFREEDAASITDKRAALNDAASAAGDAGNE